MILLDLYGRSVACVAFNEAGLEHIGSLVFVVHSPARLCRFCSISPSLSP
jgi:hypothetical protein